MATESKINEDVVAVPVPQGTLDAVSNGTFYNPHEVLGGHLGSGKHADVVTIRVLRPLAKSVTIITEQGQTLAIHEYNGVFMALVPAAAAEEGYGVPDYRIRTEYEDGSVVVSDDPYRYLPTIGEMDMYLFGEGRHERLWEALGAHVLRYDDPMGSSEGVDGEQVVGTAFTVWAPNAHAVRVVGVSMAGTDVPTPCANLVLPAFGNCSSQALRPAKSTSMKSSTPITNGP